MTIDPNGMLLNDRISCHTQRIPLQHVCLVASCSAFLSLSSTHTATASLFGDFLFCFLVSVVIVSHALLSKT